MSAILQPIYYNSILTGGSLLFNNIPQGYQDLLVRASIKDNTSGGGVGQTLYMQFNGDGSAIYSSRWMEADGTNRYSSSNTNQTGFRLGVVNSTGATPSNAYGSLEIVIPNYTSGNFKNFTCDYVTENNGVANYMGFCGGTYRGRQPITSLSLGTGFTLNQYTSISLYGLVRASNRPKASGGQITTDGTYWYHTFRNVGSSTFIPNQNISADILLVGGGGSGGFGGVTYSEGAGGGGAGGVLLVGAQMLNAGTSYSLTVGAGGVARTGTYQLGASGGDSSFGSYVAYGGGFGAVGGGGGNGASGGGGGADGGSRIGGNSVYWLQGYNGGSGFGSGTASLRAGGGGGGFSAAGISGTSGVAGNGGIGTAAFTQWGIATGTGQQASSSGSLYGLVYYAGGGGASVFAPGTSGNGGLGGGGNGSSASSGIDGLPNTGGGGGGSSTSNTALFSGAGGSGVVIIRYPV